MGLIIDEKENPQRLNFEIRSESICFYDAKHIFSHGDHDIEISKEYLRKIVDLCEDFEWKSKVLGI